MQRFIRLGAALAVAAGLVAGPAAAGPAAAHGGPIDVELGTDGTGGVSVTLAWARDGHPVEESAVVVVRAVSGTGDEVGPVTLVSASEGVGWYRSEPAMLGEGHWTVTARLKEPRRATVKTEVDVVAAAEPSGPEPSEPEPSSPLDAEVDAADVGARAAEGSLSSGDLPGWPGWVLGALVLAGAMTAVVLRRRTT